MIITSYSTSSFQQDFSTLSEFVPKSFKPKDKYVEYCSIQSKNDNFYLPSGSRPLKIIEIIGEHLKKHRLVQHRLELAKIRKESDVIEFLTSLTKQ